MIGDLPTRQQLFETLPKFQDPYFDQLKEYLAHGNAPRRSDLPGNIEPDPDHDGRGLVGRGTARGGAGRRAWNRVMDAYGSADPGAGRTCAVRPPTFRQCAFWADFAGRIGMRLPPALPGERRVPARPLTERPLVWLVLLAVLLLATYVYPAIDVIRSALPTPRCSLPRSIIPSPATRRSRATGPCWHPPGDFHLRGRKRSAVAAGTWPARRDGPPPWCQAGLARCGGAWSFWRPGSCPASPAASSGS